MQCTVSGTNFVYIVIVSRKNETYNHNPILPLYLFQNDLIDLWTPKGWQYKKVNVFFA